MSDETTGTVSIPCPTCRGSGRVPAPALTPREAQALRLLAECRTQMEVARQMGIGRARVAQLAARAREKLEGWEARRG